MLIVEQDKKIEENKKEEDKKEEVKKEEVKKEENKIEGDKKEEDKKEEKKIEENKKEEYKKEEYKKEEDKKEEDKKEENKIEENKIKENKIEENKIEEDKKEEDEENKIKRIMENINKIFLCEKCNSIPFYQVIFDIPEPKIYIQCDFCGENRTYNLQKFIENQIEKNKSTFLNKINDNLLCQLCEKKKPIKFCIQCMRLFCEDCLNLHNNDKKYKKHFLIEREIKLFKYCNIHLGSHQKFYCKTCKQGLCNECLNLNNHLNHECEKISLIFKSFNIELIEENLNKKGKEFIEKISEKSNLFISYIEKKINELNTFKTDIENEIINLKKANNNIICFIKQLIDNFKISKAFSNYNSYINLLSHIKFSNITIPPLNENKDIYENYYTMKESLSKQSIISLPENILIFKEKKTITLNSEINNIIQINQNNFALSKNNLVEIYDIKRFNKIISIPGHNGKINCLNLLDNKTFVSGGNDGKIFLWNTSPPFIINGIFETHNPIDVLSIGNNINEINSISLKGQILRLDRQNFKCISKKEFKFPFKNAINCGIYQVFSFNDTLFKFSFLTQIIMQNKNQFEIVDRHKNLIEILVNLNNEFFASSSIDCEIRIYNVKTNRCMKILFGFNENIISISFNNFFLFALSENYKIFCWNFKYYKPINVITSSLYENIFLLNERTILFKKNNIIHCFENNDNNIYGNKDNIFFIES